MKVLKSIEYELPKDCYGCYFLINDIGGNICRIIKETENKSRTVPATGRPNWCPLESEKE